MYEGVKIMKKVILVLALLIVLSIPIGVYAATSDNFSRVGEARRFCGYGIDTSNLTEQQKTDFEESFNEMIEIKRESINKMIENGLLTKEQGDLALEKLDEMVEYQKENDFGYGMGMMKGFGRGRGMMGGNGYGRRIMDGNGNNFKGSN